jgi:hypothetical protein
VKDLQVKKEEGVLLELLRCVVDSGADEHALKNECHQARART